MRNSRHRSSLSEVVVKLGSLSLVFFGLRSSRDHSFVGGGLWGGGSPLFRCFFVLGHEPQIIYVQYTAMLTLFRTNL